MITSHSCSGADAVDDAILKFVVLLTYLGTTVRSVGERVRARKTGRRTSIYRRGRDGGAGWWGRVGGGEGAGVRWSAQGEGGLEGLFAYGLASIEIAASG